MNTQNDTPAKNSQQPDNSVHKGEKHQAAPTDDDTSKGADRAADSDNESHGEERSVSRDEEKE